MMSHETAQSKPKPQTFFSYPQTLAILERQLGATDRELAMWVSLGSSDGGIDAYRDVHEFADPPKVTLCGLLDDEEKNPKEPNYLAALEGMFFRRDDVSSFTPRARYISFDALKLRWSDRRFCRSEKRAVEAIRARVLQSRLADYVPGDGFSQLSFANSASHPPPEWALFSVADLNDIEADDLAGADDLPGRRMQEGRVMTRKVTFWLAPNEILIPADEVSGAIAETLYPPLLPNDASNDRNGVERLKAEREHSRKLREKYPNLPDGYKFSVRDLTDYLAALSLEIKVLHRSPTSVEAAQNTTGWYDATLGAAVWFDLHAVKPQEAATLLCRFNPHDNQCDPLADLTDETSPDDYKRLLRVFEDVANTDSQPRKLLQWLAIARDKGLKYHSWIDEYENAVVLVQKGSEQNTSTRNLERNKPITDGAQSKKRGITKSEILDAEWPIPTGAPSLESILNKIPKWVEAACIKVGRPGRGPSGSHLWNPAMLAVCLATRTPHKNWSCRQQALTDLIRRSFSDYLEEWSEKQEML